jgi:hypothetical protein
MNDNTSGPIDLEFETNTKLDSSPRPRESSPSERSPWDFNTSVKISDEPEIRSPDFNPPASTWTLPVRSSAPMSAQDTADKKLIGQLLNFQTSTGYFVFDFFLMDANALFGKNFVEAIKTLKTSNVLIQRPSHNAAILAATIATIVLLEVRYQSCKDLWILTVSKARSYVDVQVPKGDRRLIQIGKSLLLLDSSKSNRDLSTAQHRTSLGHSFSSIIFDDEDQQQPLRGSMSTQADSTVTFPPSLPSIFNKATPPKTAAPTSEAQAPTTTFIPLSRRSFFRDEMKRLRQTKGEADSQSPIIIDNSKKEEASSSARPSRRSWKSIKDFRSSSKIELKSSGLQNTEIPTPNDQPLTTGMTTGLSVPSSTKSKSSFASEQRSWVGLKEEMSGDVDVKGPLAPSPGLVAGGGDLVGRRVALETVPVD